MRGSRCGVAITIVTLLSACSSGSVTERPDGKPVGLVGCAEPGSVVAAFTASDEGVGFPYESPESPRGPNVWTMTADGAVSPLTDDDRSADPWLSRDAERVYFTRAVELGDRSPTELWVHDLTTGREELVIETDGGQIIAPEESPDGSRVAYAASSRDDLQTYIFVKQLDDPAPPARIPTQATSASIQTRRDPTWSPDGRSLAYLLNEEQATWTVRVFDFESQSDTMLYAPPYAGSPYVSGLEWSPDGASLLVTESTLAERRFTRTTVAVEIDAGSGERSIVAENLYREVTLASADGTVLRAVGRTLDQLGPFDSVHPVLATWTGPNDMTVEELPLDFSFAHQLTLAHCSFAHGGTPP